MSSKIRIEEFNMFGSVKITIPNMIHIQLPMIDTKVKLKINTETKETKVILENQSTIIQLEFEKVKNKEDILFSR